MRAYYDSGGVTIYHGDYRDVLPRLATNSVNCVLTDPPYAITRLSWDQPVDWAVFWSEINRICTDRAVRVLFGAGQFTNKLINTNQKHFRYELIWEKTMPTGFLDAKRRPLRSHENILVFIPRFRGSVYHPQMIVGREHARGAAGGRAEHYGSIRRTAGTKSSRYYPRSVLRFGNARAGRSFHPTQKNLELMRWLVRTYSNRGQVILDSFCGSGTTLLAARQDGRRAIGIEREERFCEIAAERLTRVIE
ncbi:MAG: DNA-methyltransferase [Pyrinomonadaceae bacterium]